MTKTQLDFSKLALAERTRLLEDLWDSLDPADVPRRIRDSQSDALRASEVRYRLFESAKDGILILDAETGLIEDVNPYLSELLGYPRDMLLHKHVWELGFLADIVANRANFLELREKGFIRYDDKALQAFDGRRIEVEFVSNVYLADGRRVIQCNIRDMTEQRQAQVELQAAQRLTKQIIDALPVRVFWKDKNLVYLGCNAVFARDAGLADPRDIIGKDDTQMVWREQATRYRDDDRQIIETGLPKLLIEEPQTTPDGHTITLLTSKVPLYDATGEISGVLGTYQDITPMKQAEANIALLAMAIQQTAEAIIITDAHGTILDVNPAFEQATGYAREEVLGRNPRILKSGEQDAAFYRQMWAELVAGRVWRGRMTNRRKDGTLYNEEVSISPMRDAQGKTVNFVAVKRDITRQQQMEAQLRRAQRLESIGTLAGGVAHDLNNALAPILMAAGILRIEFPDRAEEDLDLIEGGARRAADLSRRLLTFARGAEGDRSPIQIQPLFDEMERMVRGTFPKKIDLRIERCPDTLPAVLGDATQLHQVLLNLSVNARDAMPDGGTLSLKADVTDLATTLELETLKAKPGLYVVVQVTDTGTGIKPEVMERIFEPFFSTKTKEGGTGIGLATTLGIIKGHGGFIRVYSPPEKGTTFRIYLPAHTGDANDAALPPVIQPTLRGQGQTILVVDDEVSVRDILRKVLTRMDFKVLAVPDGTTALLEVAEHGTGLAAVITDLDMPEMSGLDFIRVLLSRVPEAAVIVVSGLVGEAERDELSRLGVRAVLDKPFTEAELVEALQESRCGPSGCTP